MEMRYRYDLELLDLLLYLKLKILLEKEFTYDYTQLSFTNKTPLDIIYCLEEINGGVDEQNQFKRKIIEYSLKRNKYTREEQVFTEPHVVKIEVVTVSFGDIESDDELTIKLLDEKALESLIDQEIESFSKNVLVRHPSPRSFYGVDEQERIVWEEMESICEDLKNDKFPFHLSSVSDPKVDTLRTLLLLKKKNKIAITRTWNERKKWLVSQWTGRANMLTGPEYESVIARDRNCFDITVHESNRKGVEDISSSETKISQERMVDFADDGKLSFNDLLLIKVEPTTPEYYFLESLYASFDSTISYTDLFDSVFKKLNSTEQQKINRSKKGRDFCHEIKSTLKSQIKDKKKKDIFDKLIQSGKTFNGDRGYRMAQSIELKSAVRALEENI